MARVYLSQSFKGTEVNDLPSALSYAFGDLQDQLNGNPAIHSILSSDTPTPQNMLAGDVVFNTTTGSLKIGMFDGNSVIYQA